MPSIAPDTEQRKLRLGRFALLSALTGIGVPALMMGVLMLLPRTVSSAGLRIESFLADAWLTVCLSGAACGVAAVVAGGMAHRTRAGRWGLILPLSVLLISVVLILTQHHLNGTWPWQGFNDDCGCDGSG